jgi:uncharacterized protein YigA (DUF484 family)
MSASSDDATGAAPEKAAAPEHDEPSAESVVAFLRRHPAFLNDHPELFSALVPPEFKRGEGVLDMQAFMVGRLQSEMRNMERREKTLLAAAEANAAVQARILEGAEALLRARSFENLIRVINDELPEMLAVGTISLCVETEDPLPGKGGDIGVIIMKAGMIDSLFTGDETVALHAEMTGEQTIFGAAAGEVRSVALLRLRFGPGLPIGLLALGANEADEFDVRQSTDLLAFVARVVEFCVRRWLGVRN